MSGLQISDLMIRTSFRTMWEVAESLASVDLKQPHQAARQQGSEIASMWSHVLTRSNSSEVFTILS